MFSQKEEAGLIRTQAGIYELIEENRNGWNPEAFKERYSDVLDKYDFIVGDWGYGQLRMRGFYENTNRKVPFEQKIATLDEYLQEFCNFGCPYFVLRRTKAISRGEGTEQLTQAELEALDISEIVVQRTETPPRFSRGQQEGKQEQKQRPFRQKEQRFNERSNRDQKRPFPPRQHREKVTQGEKRGSDHKPTNP
ncbi:DUF1027 domain-containing protein [Brevibacillus fluminis]|uniref:DUF1027 domain-containing protein n=1 Tax=Brevibacillus fluminis TaxID=511487 RepID=A0A3M8DBV9_9BACL|nr:DUF1027 domain-containing protein [Brevibacillus fluminis]